MVKRKAEESQRRGKAPARPSRQPPPQADDSSDSDVCEIISPPSSSVPPTRRQNGHQPSGVAFPSVAGASHAFLQPQRQVPFGLMSMVPGMPPGFPFPQAQGAGFGLGFGYHSQFAQRIQPSGGFNPLLYTSPQQLQPAPTFHGGYFPAPPVSLAAGASSSGSSSPAVASVAPVTPRVRVREGSAAQEVKEEPDDPLRPNPSEVGMVEMLRKHGVSTPDAVYSLRKSGNRFEVALQLAMDLANTRAESRELDRARLESEKEKDRVAEMQRVKDRTLLVLGEVISHFPQSLLLSQEDGCATFRRFVERLSSGDGTCTQALCAFREKAITLLFLERDASRHYPENDRQVRMYFRKLSERIQSHVAAGPSTDEDGKRKKEDVSGEEGAGTAKSSERATKVGGCSGDEAADDRATYHLTARIEEEVRNLQRIMYLFPKTPGGVPEAFLDERAGNVATLEKDGVEEDHDRKRLDRPKDSVVITIDD